MKKLLTMTLVLALAACGREYYRGDSRYIQYGDDCHYTFSQRGGNFRTSDESVKLDENKKIRYRDASCREIMQRDMGNAKIDNAAASNPVPTNIEWRDEIVAKPVLKQMRYVPAKSSCAKPACTRKIVTSRPARDTSYSVRTYKVVPANY